MLQGEIKRDFYHSYLVFPMEREQGNYQMQMLVHQKIPGVLPCMIRRIDGKQLFSYDISEKVSMKQLFEEKELDYENLEKLLQTLGDIVENMKDYLLDMELLVLMPEYIFCEESKRQWFFVCFPREGENVYDAIHELSKYFLTVLNHKEEKAVQMGYALYRSTMNQNFPFGQVLLQLQEQIRNKRETEENRVQTEMKEVRESGNEQREGTIVNETPIQERDTLLLAEAGEKKKGFSFNGNSGKQKKKGTVERSEKREKKRSSFMYKKIPQVLSYAAEGVFAYGACPCMLKGITKPKTTLQVQGFPYLVGSLECAVDGYVDSNEVSHFHARIQKEEKQYYITDLNSKTGTFVNGQRIASEISHRVKEGDRIAFGDAEFMFVCKS